MSEAVKLLEPDAISKVLAKELEEVTEEDINALISHYRAEREVFLKNEAQGKSARKISPTSTASPSKSAKAILAQKIADLDLGDL